VLKRQRGGLTRHWVKQKKFTKDLILSGKRGVKKVEDYSINQRITRHRLPRSLPRINKHYEQGSKGSDTCESKKFRNIVLQRKNT